MFEEIFCQDEKFKNFLSQVKTSKQAYSYLISSKDGFSAVQMATLFAKALLCPDLCGRCDNCKKIEHNSHPDVKFFPEGAKLLVEDSKKIVEESFTRPIFSDKKIFIIKDVDLSTEEAQNKLLKSLEEPNANVYYILTTTNLEKVLPTIRSRCFKVTLSLVKEKQILDVMRGDEQTKRLAIKLGGGYLSKSVELSKNKNLQEIVSLAIGVLKDLNSSKDAISYVKQICDLKTDFPLFVETVGIVVEDAISIKTGKEMLTLDMFKEEETKIATQNSLKCLSSICTILNRAMRDASYNVNLPLVADNLVMNILEVKYLCK